MNHRQLLADLLKQYVVLNKLSRKIRLTPKTIVKVIKGEQEISDESKAKIEKLAIEKNMI